MMLEKALGVVGLVIAVVTLVFTDQGREIGENIRNRASKLVSIISIWRQPPAMEGSLHPGDRSTFVADTTIPDGTKVKVNSHFTKIWEIRNNGSVTWNDRYLQRQGPIEGPGRLKSPLRIQIPYTEPGQSCRVAVPLIAPPLPGSSYAEWKMVDQQGRIFFSNQKPVYVSVDVMESP